MEQNAFCLDLGLRGHSKFHSSDFKIIASASFKGSIEVEYVALAHVVDRVAHPLFEKPVTIDGIRIRIALDLAAIDSAIKIGITVGICFGQVCLSQLYSSRIRSPSNWGYGLYR